MQDHNLWRINFFDLLISLTRQTGLNFQISFRVMVCDGSTDFMARLFLGF